MGLDTSHDAFHGAYSAFNRLRQEVSRARGGSFPPHAMTYTVPPKPEDPKPRYVEVTDLDLISAIQRGALTDPIGGEVNGKWYAEAHSLRQFRGLPVEFDV